MALRKKSAQNGRATANHWCADDTDLEPLRCPMPEPETIPVTPAAGCSREMTPEKKKAIQGYLNTLGPKLRAKYGHQKSYSPQQVRSTIQETALNFDYACFAFMLYCSPEDFTAIHAAAGEVCDAEAMRQTVADSFFSGNTDFDAIELADGLWGGVVHIAQTGADVTLTVMQSGAEVAVNLAAAGASGAVSVVSSGAGAIAEGVGTVFGWLGDVDWGGLIDLP